MSRNIYDKLSGDGAVPPVKRSPALLSQLETFDSSCQQKKKVKLKLTLKQQFEILWDKHKLRGIVLEKEFRFHEERKWRFDYAIPQLKIAIELDGFGGARFGGHQTIHGISNDHEKHNAAIELGWIVLHYDSRLMGSKTKRQAVAEQIRKIILAKVAT